MQLQITSINDIKCASQYIVTNTCKLWSYALLINIKYESLVTEHNTFKYLNVNISYAWFTIFTAQVMYFTVQSAEGLSPGAAACLKMLCKQGH